MLRYFVRPCSYLPLYEVVDSLSGIVMAQRSTRSKAMHSKKMLDERLQSKLSAETKQNTK